MARTLNPAAHALRRDAFLDAAQRLMQTKGYEQMSIQDVLDELDVSRGAFYHYFDSKVALLDGVVQRMVDSATQVMAAIVADDRLTAPQKLQAMFAGLASFKAERREFLLALMHSWLSDENALMRDKFQRGVDASVRPLLATIIREGVAQGLFDPTAPDEAARVIVSLLQGANHAALDLFFAREAKAVTLDEVRTSLAAYAEAFDRVLGAAPGSFPLIDEPTLRLWFG